jgi:hypothetical protein
VEQIGSDPFPRRVQSFPKWELGNDRSPSGRPDGMLEIFRGLFNLDFPRAIQFPVTEHFSNLSYYLHWLGFNWNSADPPSPNDRSEDHPSGQFSPFALESRPAERFSTKILRFRLALEYHRL